MTLISHSLPNRVGAAENAEIVEPVAPDRGRLRHRLRLRRRLRSIRGGVLTALSAVLVYLVLVVPETASRVKEGVWVPGAFLRVPLEAILGGAVLIALAPRRRRPVAVLMGLGLAFVAVLKVTNLGFRYVLGRRFNPVLDWPLLGDGYNALTETDGKTVANAAVVGAILLAVVVAVTVTLAVMRLAKVTIRYANPARRALVGLTAVWFALSASGVTLFPNYPVASDSAAVLLKTTAKQVPASIRDQRQFVEASRNDPYRGVPADHLVSGLRGKDVIVGVVESYGRTALEDPRMAAIVDPVLRANERKLTAAGYVAESGWLTSSTFGGGSWLAHASFQSGLWINSQPRYRQLTASDRLTLTKAFHNAGWQTVGVEPGNTVAWPEASFYGYETVYDSRNLGYQGPKFGWSRMPDQYTLAAFQRNVYGNAHKPVMAEITLTSSHEPWTPVPEMVGWDQVGDGQIFGPMAQRGEPRKALWADPEKAQTEYAKSVAYSLDALLSWAEKYGDENLVLVMFGDHQPLPMIVGAEASHDVPITIIARDRTVLERVAGWGWSDGLKPAGSAPVWRMDEFRDKFFTAFGKQNTVALPGH